MKLMKGIVMLWTELAVLLTVSMRGMMSDDTGKLTAAEWCYGASAN